MEFLTYLSVTNQETGEEFEVEMETEALNVLRQDSDGDLSAAFTVLLESPMREKAREIEDECFQWFLRELFHKDRIENPKTYAELVAEIKEEDG